ncbi:binding-protein-dependent transport systems inner membrane component [Cellulomonas flavigena DSM 20109]|uniref:Binding-protein-dependent transport systems inner membrane component n=1 Tax=Cellulomonas flavigena (strain ATCC 482 / DSM 20109 / BCRC 11376 / JCM 18109 / NBRC 3775 / NCIMB 8073 / NRS 134) TaxID=446466 RepID=D5UJP4_CELFN|nr:ABC transporter permease subunit [Cellulomonas flavigena]ADG75682.1 binding-protein-dependent transport systems inner membrane component [Cellulomonas flavigena DSM 20109]
MDVVTGEVGTPAATSPPGARRVTRLLRRWAPGTAGVVGIVAVWWLAAVTVLAGTTTPTPLGVARGFAADGLGFYVANVTVTLEEAVRGFLVGNGLALALASLVLLVPALERLVMQVAVISYCLPLVAITPILYIVIGPPPSGEPSGTAVVLAALSVFFTTVVGAVLGFRSADPAVLDVVTVLGGGRWQQLVRVRLVAALPGILGALQVAAPAALLGAILGEYIGGVDRGVGPALVNAGQSLNGERAWGIALVCALLAGAGYALFALVARAVTPWASGGPSAGGGAA